MRDGRGRFTKGSSGNPRGRPPGIPNPKRRSVGIRELRKNPQAVMALLDRKPHLLLPLTAQILPPRARAVDPAERLGLDLSTVATPADAARVLPTVLAAAARGDIAPAEAARIARRVRTRLRAARRLERLRRRLARQAVRLATLAPFLQSGGHTQSKRRRGAVGVLPADSTQQASFLPW